MRTPASAILWESWRQTRLRIAVCVSIEVILMVILYLDTSRLEAYPDELLTSTQKDPGSGFFLVWVMATILVFSVISKLADNRRGFAFSLGYARPVPTWLLVGLPMAYVCVSSLAAFIIPVIVVKMEFGIPYRFAPHAAVIAVITLLFTACVWSTSGAPTRAAALACGLVLVPRFFAWQGLFLENSTQDSHWPETFGLSWAGYGAITLVAAAAIVVTIASVERRRRGDDKFSFRQIGGDRVPGWLMDLFRVPCPTSSPTLAQLWFEMKCVGAPVLAIGVAIALLIPALRAITTYASEWDSTILPIITIFPLFPLLAGCTWIFRSQGKRGSTAMGAFDATRALGTARLAGLKVLVTVGCILGAWAAIRAILWASVALIGVLDDIATPETEAARGALPAYLLAAGVAVALIWFSTAVACFASFQVLGLLYSQRIRFIVWGLAFSFLVLLIATSASFAIPLAWIVAVLIPMGTVYVFREALASRILTPRHTGAAILLWAVFAAVYLPIPLSNLGLLHSGEPSAYIALTVSSSLIPLAAVALAPWSLGLMRHR